MPVEPQSDDGRHGSQVELGQVLAGNGRSTADPTRGRHLPSSGEHIRGISKPHPPSLCLKTRSAVSDTSALHLCCSQDGAFTVSFVSKPGEVTHIRVVKGRRGWSTDINDVHQTLQATVEAYLNQALAQVGNEVPLYPLLDPNHRIAG